MKTLLITILCLLLIGCDKGELVERTGFMEPYDTYSFKDSVALCTTNGNIESVNITASDPVTGGRAGFHKYHRIDTAKLIYHKWFSITVYKPGIKYITHNKVERLRK